MLALPLERDEDADTEPEPFTAGELPDHVSVGVEQLRSSPQLSPAGRLGRLSAHEMVFVHAERLLRARSAPAVDGILPNLSRAPRASMPSARARVLADRPEEIARLYRCFRVEAWGRDLTTSCFFTVGADEQMLYLEWTHCVLLPIQERFRSIDRPVDRSRFRRMLGVRAELPASVPVRAADVLHRFK